MGTRSTIKFISKINDELEPIVNVYQQYDGYVEGVGYDLANFLKSKKIINGISSTMRTFDYANGFGCLIAQFIKEFKTEIGLLYITNLDDIEEYNYEVIFDEDKCFSGKYDSIDDLVIIKVNSIFEGTPSELLEFKEGEDD